MFTKLKRKIKRALATDDPQLVIEKIMGRGLDWYDYQELEYAKRLQYWRDSQKILMNETFMNEMKHFVADLVKEITTSSADENKDKRLRYSINGVQALMERIEGVENPEENKSTEENLDDLI